MSKHYLIFGRGMLAKELDFVLEERGHTCELWSRQNGVDISDYDSMRKCVLHMTGETFWRWHGVFNAAAYTNVDAAEADARGAFAVNALGAETVARLSSVPLVHFSTDAVFDDGDARYVAPRFEAREPGVVPRSVYGRSKLLGERLVQRTHPSPHILRIGNTYGAHGKNWASTLRQRLLAGEAVAADNFRFVAPTWARWVAEVAVDLISQPAGLYHACARSSFHTWSNFAEKMAALLGIDGARIDSKYIEYKAPRSRRGDLASDMLPLRGIDVPTWDTLLSRYLASCSTSPTSVPSAAPVEPAR